MKQFLAMALSMLFLITLCSCGNNGDATTVTENSLSDVSTAPKTISGIVLSTDSIEIQIGESYQIDYTILPNDLSGIEIEYQSANDSVASIDNTGVIVGVGEGQTNIILSSGDIYSTCSVTVLPLSAYDSLSEKEKEFVDLFIENINVFYDPASVTIKYYSQATLNTTGTWDITVSAHNQMGGFSEKDYTLDKSGNITESILGHVIMPGWEKECNLDLINQAIQEKIS